MPDDIVSPRSMSGRRAALCFRPPSGVRRTSTRELRSPARPDGEGRVVIETVESIRERVWAAAPQPAGHDMTAEARAMRNEDNLVADEASARRAGEFGSEGDSAAAGAALLARLGL